MTKEELLNKLDGWYCQDGTLELIKKLVRGTSEDDPDFKKALDDEIADQLISVFVDCYDAEGLLNWLAEHDYDLFSDYRYAEVVYRDDYEDEEDFIENSGAFYNGEPDCLCYNEDAGVYVISW